MLDKELADQLTDAEKNSIEQMYLSVFPTLVSQHRYELLEVATKEIVTTLAKVTISLRSGNSL